MTTAASMLDTQADQATPNGDWLVHLVSRMTLSEKIGQLCQCDVGAGTDDPDLVKAIREGRVGSLINAADRDEIDALQALAVSHSRLGIPLIFARDVIHGFKTMFPIPLGQAASFNPSLVERAARIAAIEASQVGIKWTFAPMLDISRDARWGRIAESFGEDPYLTSILGVAMINGFQTKDLGAPTALASCAKHFVGYGASEGGRDYSATNISLNELHNNYLPPFKMAIDAGAASIMSSFSDFDGVPVTGNRYLLRDILRTNWHFQGVLISDWNAVQELVVHGLAESDREAAMMAVEAGVDIEMSGPTFAAHLPDLIRNGHIDAHELDAMVLRVLQLKDQLGLFKTPISQAALTAAGHREDATSLSRELARESLVLLKNEGAVLPLQPDKLSSIALLGPLVDAPQEQVGTWAFDADYERCVTPFQALKDIAHGRFDIICDPVLTNTRDRNCDRMDQAVAKASSCDIILVCLGEDAILSGEAHSRARLDLPGAQLDLLHRLQQTGKPIVTIIQAGRPLVLADVQNLSDALIFAWHPGSQAGPALMDVLFGQASPSGRLPISMPRSVGQIPIHYNRKNTGRPPKAETILLIDDIPADAKQTSFGMTAFHLDDGYTPLFPFGFGLTYGQFDYDALELSTQVLGRDQTLLASARITNNGRHTATETVQLYIRDRVASVTRPVRELKGFQKVTLAPGQSCNVTFSIEAADLAFFGRDLTPKVEAGQFDIWIAPHAEAGLHGSFRYQDGGGR